MCTPAEFSTEIFMWVLTRSFLYPINPIVPIGFMIFSGDVNSLSDEGNQNIRGGRRTKEGFRKKDNKRARGLKVRRRENQD
jgi:hypothetical protein